MALRPEFWDEERRRLMALVGPLIEEAAKGGVRAFRQALQAAGVDQALANLRAQAWAQTYTNGLLAQLGTTNEKLVGEALAEWISEPGATVGDLRRSLMEIFPEERADLIAITETTRAYGEGNAIAFQGMGVQEWRWNTNNDELVCAVCGPLNGQTAVIGEQFADAQGNLVFFRGDPVVKFPAHPGCRCWPSPVVRRRQ